MLLGVHVSSGRGSSAHAIHQQRATLLGYFVPGKQAHLGDELP